MNVCLGSRNQIKKIILDEKKKKTIVSLSEFNVRDRMTKEKETAQLGEAAKSDENSRFY